MLPGRLGNPDERLCKLLKMQMIMKKSAMYVIMSCDRIIFSNKRLCKNYFCATV